jgi:peptidoglycan hydrolase-like protein with peptidoglycan-binding domain
VTAALILAGAGGWALAGAIVWSGRATAPARAGQPGAARLATAPVARANLVTTTQVDGSLGYARSYAIVDELAGTAYTALPPPGRVARRGARLFEVDSSPAFLFYGRKPAWRALALGVSDGPDVVQLDANLIALGYATATTLPVSTTFTAGTKAAVERWQYASGLPVTGIVGLGQVVYAPGAIRVTSVAVTLGQAPQPGGTVLTATSDIPVVIAQVPVAQEYLIRAGDQVSVLLPDGAAVAGRVVSVSTTARASSDSNGAAAPVPAASGPGGSNLTVTAAIRLARPRAAGNLDQAPVTVNIVSARADGVLAVPITALVALAGGGYGVDLVAGSSVRLVAVRPGMFTSTLVQVAGAGIHQGALVQIPAS